VRDVVGEMRIVCYRHQAPYVETALDAIAGVAANVGSGLQPVNGLRHWRGGTSGWFIWAGVEVSDDPEFFKPIHLVHLVDRCPAVIRMLGLGEGWRFLLADDYEDAWFEEDLLEHQV
jgi:hypothetical protein